MAYGACQAARELGLEVPRDLSIVGFDDCDLSFTFNPPLTTVRQPVAQMSAAALRAAAALTQGDVNVADAAFETELVVRDSTAPPSDRP
jgi:DNA-binding LacI/PurR family transcriptional regulator